MNQKYSLAKKTLYAAAVGAAIVLGTPNSSYSKEGIFSKIGEGIEGARKPGKVQEVVTNIVGGFANGLIGAMTGVRDAVIGPEKKRTPLYIKGKEVWAKYFTAKGRRESFVEKQRELFVQGEIRTYRLVDRLRRSGVEIDYESPDQAKLDGMLQQSEHLLKIPGVKEELSKILPSNMDYDKIREQLKANPGAMMQMISPYMPKLFQMYDQSMAMMTDLAGKSTVSKKPKVETKTAYDKSSTRSQESVAKDTKDKKPAAEKTKPEVPAKPETPKKKISFAN